MVSLTVALDRFEREGKAVAALSHPNILVLFDAGVRTADFATPLRSFSTERRCMIVSAVGRSPGAKPSSLEWRLPRASPPLTAKNEAELAVAAQAFAKARGFSQGEVDQAERYQCDAGEQDRLMEALFQRRFDGPRHGGGDNSRTP